MATIYGDNQTNQSKKTIYKKVKMLVKSHKIREK